MSESFDTFHISGAFQRDGDAQITTEEMDAFMDKFIDLVEAEGLGFGGGWGPDPVTDEEWHEHWLKEAAWELRCAISTLESEGGVTVPFKAEAEALLDSMGLTRPQPYSVEPEQEQD